MNIDLINRGTRLVGRGILIVRKYSPEILTGIGIVGGVTAAVIASKATLELEDRLSYSKKLVQQHKELREKSDPDEYSEKEYQRDLAISYYRGVQAVVKLYAIPVALGTISIASILAGHGILRNRNAALVVAYNAVELAYNNYRGRVREELGFEKDREFLTGSRKEIVKITDEATGEVVETEQTVVDAKFPSAYAKFFDQFNKNWEPNAQTNLFFLRLQQTWANDRLRSRGFLTLNEVYRSLGIEETSDGLIIGWVMGPGNHNVVDFGLYDKDNDRTRAFINGDEKAVLLEFNPDGIIWNKI